MEKLRVLELVSCLHSKGKEWPQKSQCDRKEMKMLELKALDEGLI